MAIFDLQNIGISSILVKYVNVFKTSGGKHVVKLLKEFPLLALVFIFPNKEDCSFVVD